MDLHGSSYVTSGFRAARDAGFTLVELIVAVGLGLVILSTLYAGFRVCSQAMNLSNRLSIENRLLLAGFSRALDEVDFWSDVDRPGYQPLRVTPGKSVHNGAGQGLFTDGGDADRLSQPFTSASQFWPTAISGVPAATAYSPDWQPHLPRCWYRGDGFAFLPTEWGNPPGRFSAGQVDRGVFGDAALHGSVVDTVVHNPFGTGEATPIAAGLMGDDGRWYGRQLKGIYGGLGYYGVFEYLPPSAFLDYHDIRENHSARPEWIANTWSESSVGDPLTAPPISSVFGRMGEGIGGPFEVGEERPSSRAATFWESSVAISCPPPGSDAATTRMALARNRYMPGSRVAGWEAQLPFNQLLGMVANPEDLVRTKPRDWPEVTLDVRRWRMHARSVNQCFIRVFDPLTTRMVEINFRTTGTTLRGARLQRNLD